ncbi:MAG: class I SAM-dependent methyltransferase [Magnetococcales bacterium]|nr:class I SAM-dependent methyltransferase [Magnetococcales bacterium]
MDKLTTVDSSASYAPVNKESDGTTEPGFPTIRISPELGVPDYLEQTYWWAYLHPKGVRFFERQWLVNLILWGNYSRLRDAALTEAKERASGRTLQVACVYGDFTPLLGQCLGRDGRLDVVDVAPVQLKNLSCKIQGSRNIFLNHQDSTQLEFEDGTFDQVVLFFLLHEQPTAARVKSISEALRVTRPGGKIIFVDYHRPKGTSPFRYLMVPILKSLEPFAMDVWNHEITEWVPDGVELQSVDKVTYFGGLYQKVVMIR